MKCPIRVSLIAVIALATPWITTASADDTPTWRDQHVGNGRNLKDDSIHLSPAGIVGTAANAAVGLAKGGVAGAAKATVTGVVRQAIVDEVAKRTVDPKRETVADKAANVIYDLRKRKILP